MAEQDHGMATQAVAGAVGLLAMIGTALGGVKFGHRRGSEERRENDSAVRDDIAEIRTSLHDLRESQDRQNHETHQRIDQILMMLGGRK